MGNTPQKPEKKDEKDTTKGGGGCGNHGCGCH